MEKFKEQVTVVPRGGNYIDIVKDHVYIPVSLTVLGLVMTPEDAIQCLNQSAD